MKIRPRVIAGIGFAALLVSPVVIAGEAVVAVASNFHVVARELADRFERESGHKIKLSAASTGKLYTQIVNGAPYDAFLAADRARPARLLDEGLAERESLFVYARGALVLWSPDASLNGKDCLAALRAGAFKRVSIANPCTAPYGAAAEQVLKRLELWDTVFPRLVTGENISQTLQFVAAGGATLGFIAAAQLQHPALPATQCLWRVPAALHDPIDQAAVLLAGSGDNSAAREFLEFLKANRARQYIQQNGYHRID